MKKMTNWNLYRIFLVVVESESMQRAGEKLKVTRSAVSQSIKELESQLDCKLFLSNGTGVTATSYAIELYNQVKPVALKLDFAERNIKELDESTEGILRIVYTTNTAGRYIIECIERFRMKFPAFKLHIWKRSSNAALDSLERGEVDVVIDNSIRIILNEKELRAIKLFDMPNTAIVSKENKDKFDKLSYIHVKGMKELRKPEIWVDSQSMMLQLVSKGLGFGVGFEKGQDDEYDKLGVVKISADNLQFSGLDMRIISRIKNTTKAANEFIDMVLNKSKI